MHIEPEHLELAKRILTFWAPNVPAYAFGSRATGRLLKRTSDLDICLKGDEKLSSDMLRDVKDAFEISRMPYRVDVIDWYQVQPYFQDAIRDDLVRIL